MILHGITRNNSSNIINLASKRYIQVLIPGVCALIICLIFGKKRFKDAIKFEVGISFQILQLGTQCNRRQRVTEENTQTLRGEGNMKTEAESDRDVSAKECQGKLKATRRWEAEKIRFSPRAFIGTTDLPIPCF